MKNILSLAAICAAIIIFLASCSTPPAPATKFNYGSDDPYRQGKNLVEAIAHGSYDAAYRLMERGAPLNYQDRKDEWTPLAYAIYYNRWSIAKVLIRAGANVNLADTANRTPLMWCAMRNSIITARLLVEHGADINAVDIGGRTALQYAIIYDNDSLAAYLAEVGRQPSADRLKSEQFSRLKQKSDKEKAVAKNLKLFGTKHEKEVVDKLQTEELNKHAKDVKPPNTVPTVKPAAPVNAAVPAKAVVPPATAPVKTTAPAATAPVKTTAPAATAPVKTTVPAAAAPAGTAVPPQMLAPEKALRAVVAPVKPVEPVKTVTPANTVAPVKPAVPVKNTIPAGTGAAN